MPPKRIIDEKMNKGLSDFIVRITLPLLILSSFKGNYSPDMMSIIIKILVFTVLIFIFSIIISNLLNIKISWGKKLYSSIYRNIFQLWFYRFFNFEYSLWTERHIICFNIQSCL